MSVLTWCQKEFLFHAKTQAIKLKVDWKQNAEFTEIVKTATMAKFKPPEISWTAQDLYQEWHRFSRQAECIFDGPLHEKEESVKVSYLKLWVGDKGFDVFEGFTFAKPEDAEKLKGVLKKFNLKNIVRHEKKKTHNGCFEI